jgi:hypothetical protein
MSTLTTRSGKGSPLTNTEVDTNFTNLNTDKYESGDDIVQLNFTVLGTLYLGVNASVTAAGTTQGTATALTKTYNIVNTASANQGVQLPDASAGTRVTIFNSTTATIKIYPYSSESINDLACQCCFSLGPEKVVTLLLLVLLSGNQLKGDAVVATTIDASGLASLDGGIDVDGAFTVANTSGNIDTSGTLTVDGLASLDGGIDVDGAFTVANTSGNITTRWHLSNWHGNTFRRFEIWYTASVTTAGSTQGDATLL